MTLRRSLLVGCAALLGATTCAAGSADAASVKALPCSSPGVVKQTTNTTVLTRSTSRKRVHGHTVKPGWYACAAGHAARLIEPLSGLDGTVDMQLAGPYVGYALDTHSSGGPGDYGLYARTVTVASGKKVTFAVSPCPGPGPDAPCLYYFSARLTASGTLYFTTEAIDTTTGGANDALGQVWRLDRTGARTVLDAGAIDPWSLALIDADGARPGRVYWAKDGIAQSAVVPGLP